CWYRVLLRSLACEISMTIHYTLVLLKIQCRNMTHSDAVETLVRDKVDKLEEFYPALISCRVVIEKEALHHQQGQHFNVRLDLHVPGHEFATTREHHEDFDIAIREAFDVARRWLEDERSEEHTSELQSRE